jgi:hypothetical protein
MGTTKYKPSEPARVIAMPLKTPRGPFKRFLIADDDEATRHAPCAVDPANCEQNGAYDRRLSGMSPQKNRKDK